MTLLEFFKASEEIDQDAESMRYRREELLRKRGWKYTCQTPGSRWMWEKSLPDGRTVLVNTSTALDFEMVDASRDPAVEAYCKATHEVG